MQFLDRGVVNLLGEIVQHVMRAEEEAVQPISEGSLIGAGKATDISCRAARREEGGPDMCLTGGNTL